MAIGYVGAGVAVTGGGGIAAFTVVLAGCPDVAPVLGIVGCLTGGTRPSRVIMKILDLSIL